MKSSSVFMFLFLWIITQSIYAQTKTDETKKTVEKTSGDTTYTETVVISESEDITPRNDMIVINPLKFFLFYNLTYFHRINPKVAIGIGFQMPTIKDLDGFGFNAEMRIYPSRRSLRGFYIAPNISYNKLTTEDAETSPFSIGALIGWQWFPGTDFAIGLGIGIDYYTGTVKEGDEFEDYSGKVPAVRFDIGYAW